MNMEFPRTILEKIINDDLEWGQFRIYFLQKKLLVHFISTCDIILIDI